MPSTTPRTLALLLAAAALLLAASCCSAFVLPSSAASGRRSTAAATGQSAVRIDICEGTIGLNERFSPRHLQTQARSA